MRESTYQAYLIRLLKKIYPTSIILKNDSGYMQGMLDLTILIGSFWAMLEVKASESAPVQPNQEYYVTMLNRMSFAAFIYPENEAEVLDDLQQAYESSWDSRIS